MKCIECPHFKIIAEPIRDDNALWDFGRAECGKHNLIVDFANHIKINRLECVEKNGRIEYERRDLQ